MKKINKIADDLSDQTTPQDFNQETESDASLPDDEYFSSLWRNASPSEKAEVNSMLLSTMAQSLNEELNKLSDEDKMQIIKNISKLLGEQPEATKPKLISLPEPPSAISELAAAASKIYKSIIKY